MNKLFPALLASVFSAGVFLLPPTAFAVTAKSASKKVHKKKIKVRKVVPAPFALAAPDDDDTGAPIDPAKAMATEYKCELGAMVTIFRNPTDNDYIALRYGKMLTRMKRVSTTTGADRFENKRAGLVWIGIPAKGILLDAKQGHQLANDCKDADQLKPVVAPAVAPVAAPAVAPTTAPETVAPVAPVTEPAKN